MSGPSSASRLPVARFQRFHQSSALPTIHFFCVFGSCARARQPSRRGSHYMYTAPCISKFIIFASEKGASSWLTGRNSHTALVNGHVPNKQFFQDTICLQYNFTLPNRAAECICGEPTTCHSYSRPHGAALADLQEMTFCELQATVKFIPVLLFSLKIKLLKSTTYCVM